MKKIFMASLCAAGLLATASCSDTGSDGLTIGFNGDCSSLDIQQNNSLYTSVLAEGYAGLLVREVAGEIVCDLASSYTSSVSATSGQETFVFTMRDGITWSNGDELNAHDFEYAWKMVYTRTEAASSLQAYGFISGSDELNDWIDDKDNADATTAEIFAKADELIQVSSNEDGTQLTVVTNFGEGGLARFASNELSPVHEATYEATDPTDTEAYGREPESMMYSGAYTITKQVFGNYVQMTKNENYWNAENVVHDQITVYYYDDSTALINAYKLGEVQLLPGGTDYYAEFGETDEYHEYEAPTGNLTLLLNYNNWDDIADGSDENPVDEVSLLLQNRNFVNALSNAFDRTAMFDTSILGSGYTGSNTIVPGSAESNDGSGKLMSEYQDDYTNNHPMTTQSTTANAYLTAAMSELGYTKTSDIPTIDITTSQQEITDYIVNSVNQTLGYEALATDYMDMSTRSMQLIYHTFDIVLFGWGVSFDDPSGFINDYVSTSYFMGDWPSTDPETYATYETARTTAATCNDYAQRATNMATMEETILNYGPAIPVASINQSAVIASNLQGVSIRPFGCDFDYIYSYFE